MPSPTLVPAAAFEERYARLPPVDLWCSGSADALARPTVAIVGTRAATPYGRGVARRMARELAQAGCTILSGLALGIDTEAHLGALDAHGGTVGVLGGGHERFFPKRNAALAARIEDEGGAVLSPFPPDVAPRKHFFLARNGVVAALSDCVVVVEAPARSGALNTAHWAADRVPVFAVPGDVDRLHSAGCLALLRDGAILARSAADVLEVLGQTTLLPTNSGIDEASSVVADPVAAQIVALLRTGERTADSLVDNLGVAAPDIFAALVRLETTGMLELRGGEAYALRC